MITADELLAAAFTGEALTIDVANRIINIPASVEHLGVESDEDVLRLLFNLPRYYGDVDLSLFKIYVNYVNAGGGEDSYEVEDVETSDGLISFSWLIGRFATSFKGDVKFNICLKKYNPDDPADIIQEFNTMPVELPVKEGLETIKSVYNEYPDLFNDLRDRIARLEELIESGNVGGGGSGDGGDTGDDGEDVPATYSVTNYLTNCTTNNNMSSVANKGSYSAVITPTSGYEITNIYVLMGNVEVTASVYSDGVINIPSVTGDVIISASAEVAGTQKTLSGKWILNESITQPTSQIGIDGDGSTLYTGTDYSIAFNTMYALPSVGLHYVVDDPAFVYEAINSSGAWLDTKYRYVDFGSGVLVDDAAYSWFTANAVQGSYSGGSEGGSDEVNTYSVTNNLTNINTSNFNNTIKHGESYSATLARASGYDITSVTIIMGGTNITATAYSASTGTIYIPSVTGNIVITAIANLIPTSVISGKWIFNETLDLSEAVSETHSIPTLAASTGTEYDVAITSIFVDAATGLVYRFADDGETQRVYYKFNDGGLNDPWTLEKYRYVDFGSGVTIRETAYNWILANAVPGEYVAPPTYTIAGKWTFNSPVDLTGATAGGTLLGNVNISTGTSYDTAVTGMVAIEGVYLIYNINGESVTVADDRGVWTDSKYRYVDFGDGVEVSETFYNWFLATAITYEPQTISGRYRLNDTVTFPTTTVSSATGGKTGANFETTFSKIRVTTTTLYFTVVGTDLDVLTNDGDGTGTFLDGSTFRNVEFIEQIVSAGFFNWLMANAKKQ